MCETVSLFLAFLGHQRSEWFLISIAKLNLIYHKVQWEEFLCWERFSDGDFIVSEL